MPGSTPSTPASAQRRRQLGRRRLGEQAPVAGTVVRLEDGDLTLEAEDRAVHDGDALQQRRVVEQVPGGEVVGAVDHDVVAVDDVEDVVGAEAHVVGDDVDVGVERGERLLRGVDLAARRCGRCCGGSDAAGSTRRRRPCRRCRACRRRRRRGRARRASRGRPLRGAAPCDSRSFCWPASPTSGRRMWRW